jgi:hypothetical protein
VRKVGVGDRLVSRSAAGVSEFGLQWGKARYVWSAHPVFHVLCFH